MCVRASSDLIGMLWYAIFRDASTTILMCLAQMGSPFIMCLLYDPGSFLLLLWNAPAFFLYLPTLVILIGT
jgi:hypothetical protein